MPITVTTTLPDEDQPVLLNGVEDEVGIDRETTPTNNGDVRFQIRETGEGAWDSSATGFAEQTVAYDTLTTQFIGREDGEEYEVRGRTETADVTGAWTTPVAIVTKFPGSNSLTLTSVSPTQVDLAWSEDADNEDGQLVIRERRRPDDGGWWPETELTDVGIDTEAYSDTSVQPDTEYRYRIRAFTDDTEADSNRETITTAAVSGVRDAAVPPTGWYVEIDAPDGTTLTPTVLEGVTFPAETNAQPTVEIPVPAADRWTRDALEGQPMRVWEDGTKLPIDTFEGYRVAPDRATLLGSGGRELEQYVESVQYDEVEHDVALRDLLSRTSYAVQVDDPDATVRSDVEIVSVTISGSTDAIQIANTTPASLTLNGLRPDPTGFVEVTGLGGSTVTTTTGDWAGDEAALLESTGDTASFTFSPQYQPPSGAIAAAASFSTLGTSPGFEIRINSDVVFSASAGALSPSADKLDVAWRTTGTTGALDDGIHTVTVEITDATADGELYVDALAAYDDRYVNDADLVPASGGTIPEPAPYNGPVTVSTKEYTTVEQVIGARVTADIDDTTGVQALAVSNGSDTLTAANTDVLDGAFASNGQTYQIDFSLGGYGTQSQSPTERPNPQTVASFEGLADLDDTPILLDREFRGDLGEIIWRICDDGEFLAEVRADPTARDTARDGLRVEIARSEQRTQTVDRPLVSFDAVETIEKRYDRVVVFGGGDRVEGETFSVSSFGALTGLDETWIRIDSERVTDGSGTVYERGTDYRIDWSEGAIELLSGGSMSTGTTYQIDYEWRYRGVSTRPDAPADPRTLEEAVPSVSSPREADQVALAIRREVDEPRLGATLTVSRSEPSESLIAALSHPDVPWDGPDDIREREVVDGGAAVTYRIASRQSAAEVVADLRERFAAVANEV